MDAFVTRKPKQLFQGETFLLLATVEDGQDLGACIAGNGGAVVASLAELALPSPGDATPTPAHERPIVIVPPTAVADASEWLADEVATVRAQMHRLRLVSSEWVRQCVAKQRKLPYHDYVGRLGAGAGASSAAASASTDSRAKPSLRMDDRDAAAEDVAEQRRKRSKIADHVPTNPPAGAMPPRPSIRAWQQLHDGSLLMLDAREEAAVAMERAGKDGVAAVKIAGFDLDGTLITTKSGKRFAVDARDWKLFHPTLVAAKLEELVRTGFRIVLFSNQNGLDKGHVTPKELQDKLEAIVKKLDLPMLVLLATRDDQMRKPRIGAWKAMHKLLEDAPLDLENSFYCGDAAGRPKIDGAGGRKKDFAATDYKFALNVGIAFHTPEALFLSSKQRVHVRPDMWEVGFDPRSIKVGEGPPVLDPRDAPLGKTGGHEMVVMCGSPASGKSFFSNHYFGSAYVVVNQDELKTVAACKKRALEALNNGKSVVIDSTNRDPRTRKEWVTMAQSQGISVRCFYADISKDLAMHLNTFRHLTSTKKIPDVVIHTFYKNIAPPSITEGFAQLVRVQFQADSTHMDADALALLRFFL